MATVYRTSSVLLMSSAEMEIRLANREEEVEAAGKVISLNISLPVLTGCYFNLSLASSPHRPISLFFSWNHSITKLGIFLAGNSSPGTWLTDRGTGGC